MIRRVAGRLAAADANLTTPFHTKRRYSFQTVFPSTIVRTARPFSFQPSNGELRDAE